MRYIHILSDYSVQFFGKGFTQQISYQDKVLNEISSGIDRTVYGSPDYHFVVKVERRRYMPVTSFQSVRELGIFTKFANTGVFPKVYGSDIHIEKTLTGEYVTTVVIVEKIEDCPEKKTRCIEAQVLRLGRKYRIGDLHSENYFVTPEGEIKIIDAGIPRWVKVLTETKR